MPIARVRDVDIEYHTEGSGPALLLVGWASSQASSWGQPFLRALSGRFTLVRYSNRGTGLSSRSRAAYSIATLAADAAGLLEALGVQEAHVLGVSMGGTIAQELALERPQSVRRLVLCGTVCGWSRGPQPSPEVLEAMGPQPGLSPEDIWRRALPHLTTPETVNQARDFLAELVQSELENPTPADTLLRQGLAIQQFDSFDRLPALSVPTLIIHGDRDSMVPVEHARILWERIPNSRLQILPGAGHILMWERPEQVAGIISDFLSEGSRAEVTDR